jgi:elongation factor P
MYTVADLRKGLQVLIDDEPYVVMSFEFAKPGKGQAIYRTRMRNMLTGAITERTYRSGDGLQQASLDQRSMQYLYKDEHNYYFMDTDTFDQVAMSEEALGDAYYYLKDNLPVEVLFFREQAIGVNPPTFVNMKVISASPWAKGDTSGADSRVVTLESGYELKVPPFIVEGDILQIDTRTGQYVTRVKE